MKKIDIIIINYNSTDYLLKCLHSIYDALTKETVADVYVMDNASKDDLSLLQQQFPQVVLLKNKVNVGFSKAVNYCITRTSAPYIVLLNPDTLVENGFFTAMLDIMDNHPTVGIAGPRIMEKNGLVQGSARSFPTPMTALFGRNSLMSRIFPNNRMTVKNILTQCAKTDKNMEVDWVSGACMILRRKALKEVGPMDEQFFLYWEDADLCKRMSEKGWRVIYCPCTSVIHYTGMSSRKGIRSLIEFHKSAYYFFCKHSSSEKLSLTKAAVFFALSARFYVVLVIQCILRLKKCGRKRVPEVEKN